MFVFVVSYEKKNCTKRLPWLGLKLVLMLMLAVDSTRSEPIAYTTKQQQHQQQHQQNNNNINKSNKNNNNYSSTTTTITAAEDCIYFALCRFVSVFVCVCSAPAHLYGIYNFCLKLFNMLHCPVAPSAEHTLPGVCVCVCLPVKFKALCTYTPYTPSVCVCVYPCVCVCE